MLFHLNLSKVVLVGWILMEFVLLPSILPISINWESPWRQHFFGQQKISGVPYMRVDIYILASHVPSASIAQKFVQFIPILHYLLHTRSWVQWIQQSLFMQNLKHLSLCHLNQHISYKKACMVVHGHARLTRTHRTRLKFMGVIFTPKYKCNTKRG